MILGYPGGPSAITEVFPREKQEGQSVVGERTMEARGWSDRRRVTSQGRPATPRSKKRQGKNSP